MPNKTEIIRVNLDGIDSDEIESILAEVIDRLYFFMKKDFVDYENKGHKLGIYKENVKRIFHERLNELIILKKHNGNK